LHCWIYAPLLSVSTWCFRVPEQPWVPKGWGAGVDFVGAIHGGADAAHASQVPDDGAPAIGSAALLIGFARLLEAVLRGKHGGIATVG
jgi:hypothetical protein